MPAAPPARRPPAAPKLADQLGERDLAVVPLDDDERVEDVVVRGSEPAVAAARGITFAQCEVRGALAGARLPGVHALDCRLTADLANAELRDGALHRCTVRGARLTGLRGMGLSLRDVALEDCRADLSSLMGAKVERVTFTDCDLRDAGFEEARLRDVRLERCDLRGATFTRARLERVELVGCDLEGVRTPADLRGAAMPWEDLVANAGTFAAALGITLLEDGR